jgi:hypothetical protein
VNKTHGDLVSSVPTQTNQPIRSVAAEFYEESKT